MHHTLRDDGEFVALLNAYRGCGGLVRAEEAIALFERRHGPDVALLARWIVEGQVIAFEWQSGTWLPWFQFNRSDMDRQPKLAPVLQALNSVFDAWQLAAWFVQRHPSLGDRTPAAVVDSDFAAVLAAAQADRDIAAAWARRWMDRPEPVAPPALGMRRHAAA